jgi:hypothetical protein
MGIPGAAFRSRAFACRRWTARLRIPPGFVIIGAQRAATTSLYHYLTQHPCVAPPLRKEVHFFDFGYDHGADWYLAHFPTVVDRALHRLRKDSRYLTGEASPYYLFHPSVPERLARLLPKAKLIAMVRNPADRAISHYHRERAKGRESLPLIEAIEAEEHRLAADVAACAADPLFRGSAHHRHSYLARGRYAEQLDRWLRHFPLEQICVVRAEDLFHDPGRTYRAILAFLDLPMWEPPSYPRRNPGGYAVDPAIRARLIEYFTPHNRRLYDLLGRDLGWEGSGS